MAKKRPNPTPKKPARAEHRVRQWQILYRACGATEGDNHRARVAIERLSHLLSEDKRVRHLFSVLMTRHAKAFAKGLGKWPDSVHADVLKAIDHLVEERLGPSYEAVSFWLYVAFLIQLTQPADRRVTVAWTAEPVPPLDLNTQLIQDPPCTGETLDQYRERIQQTRPERLKKGRKPRNAGHNLRQYVRYFYQLKWCGNISQNRLATSYATEHSLTGDHRGRIRLAVAEVDALLQLLAPPFLIRPSL